MIVFSRIKNSFFRIEGFVVGLFYRFEYIFIKNSVYFYPSPVKKLYGEIKDFYPVIRDSSELGACTVKLVKDDDRVGETPGDALVEVRLATRFYYGSFQALTEMLFQDPEDSESLHRLNWLWYTNLEQSIDWESLLEAIAVRQWRVVTPKKKHVWNEYVVSERLSNIVLLRVLSDRDKKFSDSLAKDLLTSGVSYLCRSLAYSRLLTGNHVINNARALILSGITLRSDDLIEFGFSVLRDGVERSFSKNGVLLEGSTHYQLIVTKWLIDVALVCRAIGFEPKPWFELILVKSFSICLAIRIGVNDNFIPIIGDISPDFSPNFMSGFYQALSEIPQANDICDVDFESGYRLGANYASESRLFLSKPSMSWRTEQDNFFDCESGWLKLRFQKWQIFARLPEYWFISGPGHFHNDVGHVTVRWDGSPFLVDIGRLSYQGRKSEDKGVLGSAHNIITVNGSSICDGHFLYDHPKHRIIEGCLDVFSEYKNRTLIVSYQHNGRIGARFFDLNSYWSFSSRVLEISGQVLGLAKNDTLAFNLHFASPLKIHTQTAFSCNFEMELDHKPAYFGVHAESKDDSCGRIIWSKSDRMQNYGSKHKDGTSLRLALAPGTNAFKITITKNEH